MCVVRVEELAPAVRAGAVDVIHADIHKWGGLGPTLALYGVCQAFGLGVNFHSGGELGISTACHLHLAAVLEQLSYPIDSMYYLLQDDILTERIPFEDGALRVPQGAGLGVEVDLDRLEHFARLNQEEGDHTL
jgi:glucarate dehydratase